MNATPHEHRPSVREAVQIVANDIRHAHITGHVERSGLYDVIGRLHVALSNLVSIADHGTSLSKTMSLRSIAAEAITGIEVTSHKKDVQAIEHDFNSWLLMQGKHPRKKVITLCGSTKFKKHYEHFNRSLTLTENAVVLTIAFAMHADNVPLTKEQKVQLDEIHKNKIDMADEIFVLDVGEYIGESTRSEIAYAEKTGKGVRYLSKEFPDFKLPDNA